MRFTFFYKVKSTCPLDIDFYKSGQKKTPKVDIGPPSPLSIHNCCILSLNCFIMFKVCMTGLLYD